MSSITSYSYTEKKRIRKSFAKRANVLEVPFLLSTPVSYTHLDVYKRQVTVKAAKRCGY